MNNNILSTSGKAFQKFIGHLTEDLTKPTTKFITELLCGMLFSYNLVLTNVAARVPQQTTITAIAKRFRRHLADDGSVPELLLSNYLGWLRGRLGTDSLFVVDLTDLAKPYAKKPVLSLPKGWKTWPGFGMEIKALLRLRSGRVYYSSTGRPNGDTF